MLCVVLGLCVESRGWEPCTGGIERAVLAVIKGTSGSSGSLNFAGLHNSSSEVFPGDVSRSVREQQKPPRKSVMRAVVQRVTRASVEVQGNIISRIEAGSLC